MLDQEIQAQPAYVDLRNIISERTSSIIAWVGSGLSAPVGLPTWGALKKALLISLESKARSLTPEHEKTLISEIQAIQDESSYWIAFERLRSALGRPEYKATIRSALSKADAQPAPELYRLVWRLQISGVLNLNLDRLATKALLEEGTSNLNATEFTGSQAANFSHVLKSKTPFLANLHGVLDNEASWVFTNAELRELKKDEGYQNFIKACLYSSTVVFLGISADDTAVGGFLEHLASLGIDCGPHFWITDRRDPDTDKWAQSAGLRVIRYRSENNDHSQLKSILVDLGTHVPSDEIAPPIAPTDAVIAIAGQDRLPEPSALAHEDAEMIRLFLNKHAHELLKEPSESAYNSYEDFCKQYDEATWVFA